jgi:hypothetical protein
VAEGRSCEPSTTMILLDVLELFALTARWSEAQAAM